LISKCFRGPTLFVASFLFSQLMYARPTDGWMDRPTDQQAEQTSKQSINKEQRFCYPNKVLGSIRLVAIAN
jgi:hypothetical protein